MDLMTKSSKISEAQQERSRESRKRILEVATVEFADKSYDAVSVRSVAAIAKVKHQSIAYHFGNKQDLWMAVVDYQYGELSRVGDIYKEEGPGSIEQFRDHLKRMMMYVMERPGLFRIVSKEAISGGARWEKIKPYMKKFAEILFNTFGNASKIGIGKGVPVLDLYFIIAGAMNQRVLYPEMNKLITGSELTEEQIDSHIGSLVRLLAGDG